MRRPTIVSLLPAATEIVCALGAREQLIGVSHECDFPSDVSSLPALTRARTAPPSAALSSGEIDRALRQTLEQSLSIYEVDARRLGALAPDVVLTQDLCAVCAVPMEQVQAALDRCSASPVLMISLHPERLEHIFADIRRVAAVIGRAAAAGPLLATLGARVEAVRSACASAQPRKVLSIEWLEPVMLGGLWMPELIEGCGARSLGVEAGARAPTLDRESLAALEPDVVLIKPCGFPLSQTLRERSLLVRALPWDRWSAVSAGQVYVADGNAYFNRPGPRIVDSLELLAACIRPERFPFHVRTFEGAAVRVTADLDAQPLGTGQPCAASEQSLVNHVPKNRADGSDI